MNRPDKWNEMAANSRAAIEDFNDFSDDKAIAWADVQIGCYKEAMLAVVRGNNNWAQGVTDEQEELIETMVRRAEAL
jgi:hypothetical protein